MTEWGKLRNRLFSPPNAVVDTGFHFKGGKPVDAPGKPEQSIIPEPPPLEPIPKIYPEAYSTHEKIIRVICGEFNVGRAELLSDRRNSVLVAEARQAAVAITARLTKNTLFKLCFIFNRDHSTVRHAVAKMKPHLDVIANHTQPPGSVVDWVRSLRTRLTDPEVLKAKRGHYRVFNCLKGHPYDKENTAFLSNGTRRCRACKLAADRLRYKKRKLQREDNMDHAQREAK